jgi:hypothetical protein
MEDVAKLNKAQKFTPGPGNCLVEHVASFEKMCAMIEKHFGRNVEEMTLMQFMSRLESIKDELKPKSQSGLVGELKPEK